MDLVAASSPPAGLARPARADVRAPVDAGRARLLGGAAPCLPPAEVSALDDPAEQALWTTLVADPTGTGVVAVSHFRLAGIDCAACAPKIERALLAEPGVRRAEVQAAGRQLAVTWDRAATAPSRLVEAVARAGFDAVPDVAEPARAQRRRERRQSLWQVFVAGFCAMQVMMYAAPLYVVGPGDLASDLRRLLLWASWLLSVPVLVFAAGPLVRGAGRGLMAGEVRMELPVALGIAVAFAASAWTTLVRGGAGEVWFDSLTMFVAFLLGARWLAAVAHDRVASTLEAAVERVPRTARRVEADGCERTVAIRSLRPGDRVRVLRGEAFPADGPLVEGETEVDESLLTGESRAVVRTVGDEALAGSLNLGAAVGQRVRAIGLDTRHARIVALLRSAAGTRPRSVRTADRWAAPFLVGVLALAAIAGAAWWWIDPARAVGVSVAVLIVTCPCALALAEPAAQLAAAGALARRGILLARLDALEPAAACDHVVFDKTGTLTDATPRIAAVRVDPAAAARLPHAPAVIARSLAAVSSHPKAKALAEPGAGDGSPAIEWRSRREVPGGGVEGIDASGRRYRLGSRAWALDGAGSPRAGGGRDDAPPSDATSLATPPAAAPPADAPPADVWLADAAGPIAAWTLAERLRADAAETLRELRADGATVELLSGDDPARVQAVAAALGLTAAQATGGLDPEAKLAALAARQASGHRVAMVGDGINDAPVLARADVSFALAGGSSLAQTSADVVLAGDRLRDVAQTRRVARRTARVVRQNLAFAVAYNALMVPLAALGVCPPWLAGLGMAASSLAVVGNALRLQRP